MSTGFLSFRNSLCQRFKLDRAPRVSGSVGLRRTLRIYVSQRLSGDSDAAGPGTNPWLTWSKNHMLHILGTLLQVRSQWKAEYWARKEEREKERAANVPFMWQESSCYHFFVHNGEKIAEEVTVSTVMSSARSFSTDVTQKRKPILQKFCFIIQTYNKNHGQQIPSVKHSKVTLQV